MPNRLDPLNKSEIVRELKEALTYYPKLDLLQIEKNLEVAGEWEVNFNGEVIETYNIQIKIPEDYPNSVPDVFELSGKIPKHRNRHLSQGWNWRACLFVPDQRWEIWPIGAGFLKFLKIPVHNFFLSQAYFDEYLIWPFKDRPHGDDGILDYYFEKFGTSDLQKNITLLQLVYGDQIHRQSFCPCGSKNKIRRCHGPLIVLLRENQPKELLINALSIMYTRETNRLKAILEEKKFNEMENQNNLK